LKINEVARRLLRKAKTIDIFESKAGEVLDIIITALYIEIQAKEVLETEAATEEERREAEQALKLISEVKKEIVKQYVLAARLSHKQRRARRFFEYKTHRVRGAK